MRRDARGGEWTGKETPVGTDRHSISIPESLSFFVSGWSPGETLGQWNESAPEFLAQNKRSLQETANQKNIDFPRVSPGDQLLTEKPEDSGIEIARHSK